MCDEAAAELPSFLDGSTTSNVDTVCQQALLHARHNPDVFSKVSSPSDCCYHIIRRFYVLVYIPGGEVPAVRHVWSGPEAGAGLGRVHRPQLRRPGDQQGGRLEQIPQQHGGAPLAELCKTDSSQYNTE